MTRYEVSGCSRRPAGSRSNLTADQVIWCSALSLPPAAHHGATDPGRNTDPGVHRTPPNLRLHQVTNEHIIKCSPTPPPRVSMTWAEHPAIIHDVIGSGRRAESPSFIPARGPITGRGCNPRRRL